MPNRRLTRNDLEFLIKQVEESFSKEFVSAVFNAPKENMIDISENDLNKILEI